MLYFIVFMFIISLVVYKIYIKLRRRFKIEGIAEKAVLITGCDSGLGFEMAKHLHHLGFIVIATCLKPQSNGFRTLSAIGGTFKVLVMDITDEVQLKNTVYEVKNYLNKLRIKNLYGLVNNAGVMIYGEVDWLTCSQIKNQIAVNYVGPIMLTQLFLEDIINSQGRLVYVTSLVSNVPFPLTTTYCSTKSGLTLFAEGLQSELARFGVKIVLLRPGDFTKLTDIIPISIKASNTMWNCFNERKKSLYGVYFWQYFYNLNILATRGIFSYKSYADSSLYSDIEEALTSTNPRSNMVQAFLWFHVLIKTISFLPSDWQRSISIIIQFIIRRKCINTRIHRLESS